MTDVERTALVQRVGAGDAEALQRLLIEYHGALCKFLESAIAPALRRRIEPEDVLQEAYIAAFGALRPPASVECVLDAPTGGAEPTLTSPRRTLHFDTPAAFYKWLERIVVNELRDAERAAGRKKRDIRREAAGRPAGRDFATTCTGLIAQLSATDTTPSRVLSRHESVAALMTCLARLPEDQRSAVRLRFLEDTPVAEIATRLGKSETAVYALHSRGLKALRERMASIRNAWR